MMTQTQDVEEKRDHCYWNRSVLRWRPDPRRSTGVDNNLHKIRGSPLSRPSSLLSSYNFSEKSPSLSLHGPQEFAKMHKRPDYDDEEEEQMYSAPIWDSDEGSEDEERWLQAIKEKMLGIIDEMRGMFKEWCREDAAHRAAESRCWTEVFMCSTQRRPLLDQIPKVCPLIKILLPHLIMHQSGMKMMMMSMISMMRMLRKWGLRKAFDEMPKRRASTLLSILLSTLMRLLSILLLTTVLSGKENEKVDDGNVFDSSTSENASASFGGNVVNIEEIEAVGKKEGKLYGDEVFSGSICKQGEIEAIVLATGV